MTARPFYTYQQLAEISGLSVRSMQLHKHQGWLKPTKIPGARGLRFSHADASKWFCRHFPDKQFPQNQNTALLTTN